MIILCFLLLIVNYYAMASLPEYLRKGKEVIIGIDLGTTYSRVGVFNKRNGEIELIANEYGNHVTPSLVAYSPAGQFLVGESAMRQNLDNPDNGIFNVKRFLGHAWNDTTFQNIMRVSFNVIDTKRNPYRNVNSSRKEFPSPEEVTAVIIRKFKNLSEAYVGKKITRAVMTVPFYFDENQITAIKRAGAIAGLKAVRVITEPIAATVAYGLTKQENCPQNILIYHLGGSTFELSLLVTKPNGLKVNVTCGISNLGGKKFDQRIVEYIIDIYQAKGIDIARNSVLLRKLERVAEKAKIALSTSRQVRMEINAFLDKEDLSLVLTRDKFEELNIDLFLSTMKCFNILLDKSGLHQSEIDEVLLVGASSKIPKISQLVKEFFHGKKLLNRINEGDAAVYGAVIAAATWSTFQYGYFTEPLTITGAEDILKVNDAVMELSKEYAFYFRSESDVITSENLSDFLKFEAKLFYLWFKYLLNLLHT